MLRGRFVTADIVDPMFAGTGADTKPDDAPRILNDLWHTAVQKAGYAVVGRDLGLDMGQASATGNDDSAGHSIVLDPWATLDRWWREGLHHREFRSVLRARVLMLIVGAEAELAIIGRLQDVDGQSGAEGDLAEVERIADDYPDAIRVAPARLASLRRAAGSLVRRHRSVIKAVAVALRERGALSGSELDGMAPRPKPREPHPDWVALADREAAGEVVSLSGLVARRQ